jgi:hypothetical protein
MRERVTASSPIRKIMQNVFLLVVLTLTVILFIPPAP